MPLHEYDCPDHGLFEVLGEAFDHQPCIVCGCKSFRVISAPNIVLNGPGFYATEYKDVPPSKKKSKGKKSEN